MVKRAWAVSTVVWMALLCALAGCVSASGALRYANRDPVWQVADRQLISKPDERYTVLTDLAAALFREPIIDGLGFPGFYRAENINSLGEVPNSTWWTNRIGVMEMTPAEVGEGPGEGREPVFPLTILRTKIGGAMPGFIVEDAEGVRYIFKFDETFAPELESGADVIVARLLHAVGYWVPDDVVIYFNREDLKIADDAVQEDAVGDEIPLEAHHIDQVLEEVAGPNDDGKWRGLLSRFLEGIPVGGYAMKGRRSDDLNDRVRHEDRRDVRAHGVFFAWLDQTDIKEDNTLDMWIPVREEAELGYVRHNLVDFGKALGAMGADNLRPHAGWSHQWEYGYASASLLTFGIWKRPWEGREASRIRGMGRYDVEGYEPHRWSSLRLWFPMRRMDRFDAFWASKIMMRLSRAHVEAAVATAKYSDPRAAPYITEMLLGRQRKTARRWFEGVAPFDAFEALADEDGTHRICATDLWKYYGFGDERTGYRFTSYDYQGQRTGWHGEPTLDEEGRVCAAGVEAQSGSDGYTIVRMDLERDGDELPPALVHLARDPNGDLRIIGVHRL